MYFLQCRNKYRENHLAGRHGIVPLEQGYALCGEKAAHAAYCLCTHKEHKPDISKQNTCFLFEIDVFHDFTSCNYCRY